jgi:hypothetical protein
VQDLVLGVLVAGEAPAVDELGLEGRDPGFGHRVVVGFASRADGRCGAEPEPLRWNDFLDSLCQLPELGLADGRDCSS